MALTPPEKKWWRALGKDERIWSFLIVLMILMMTIITVGYVFAGKQNPPEKFNRIEPADFVTLAQTENQNIGTPGTIPLSSGDSKPALITSGGGDVYLYGDGKNWVWHFYHGTNSYQAIQLKLGQKYSFHISGADALHGFEILDFSLAVQVVPGYDYVVDFIPQDVGQFVFACNEFCGPGHHTMAGIIEVVA